MRLLERLSSESFGPRLRWQRLRKGVTLEQIAEHTKVPVELWEAMEGDEFSGWPRGVYVRSRLRDYANLIGLDADHVVDDFCRIFPEQGDRRRDVLVRGQAEIVGHSFAAAAGSPLPPGVPEERRGARSRSAERRPAVDVRVVAAILDQLVVLAIALAIRLAAGHFWMALALAAMTYHAVAIAALGCSPGAWIVKAYAAARAPRRADVFAPIPRTLDHS